MARIARTLFVALGIAALAFGIGQWRPGLGMPLTLAVTSLWVALAIVRQRAVSRHR
ncbi:hypothetical protein [Sphingomonas morindae]|uniref:Uncharacterized protein n=1 Tax=Sphingomonas morindae TaxID=1541170 RepID=A0ABY4X9Q0_9SPHN|nr:hypothetical protein [Sphingomonas morindae]USI73672.1 hypothetical protein LHA26_04145 [Sphingomonas morindae]